MGYLSIKQHWTREQMHIFLGKREQPSHKKDLNYKLYQICIFFYSKLQLQTYMCLQNYCYRRYLGKELIQNISVEII